MTNINSSFYPALYRYRALLCAVAVLFMMALSSSLVMLPFASKQNKTVILNTVEEEAGGSSSNNINEEHKNGKSFNGHLYDFDAFLLSQRLSRSHYNIPRSVNILSTLHSKRIVQPPEC
ncbi:hypothetical protein [Flavihumibacter sp. ZG627]|uniref:hypothetical protein n=1 Tax=Flavihumibacter sp. ZG627 TaxID=1463156 RepID=UPI00057DA790|nr:hypothetical protein [Flavihumibacter sp. ZG627]KIC92185.1 hypothetical protein HY58_01080 [Flavihumibacter sp. ZG627]